MPRTKSKKVATKDKEEPKEEKGRENGTPRRGSKRASSSSASPVRNSTRNIKNKKRADESDDDGIEIIEEVKVKVSKGRGRPSVSRATPAKAKVETKKIPARKVEKKKVESEASDQEDYEVLRILDVRTKPNGKREFEIHWKGYAAKDATWEPEDKMNCPELIKEFMEKLEDNHLPRRRMSQRASTQINTRQSETRQIIHLQRVQTGRVDKRRASAPRSLHMDRPKSSNGMVPRTRGRGSGRTKENKRDWRSMLPSIGSRAIIGTGFAVSLTAAAIFSSEIPSFDWASYAPHMQHYLEKIREKIGYASVGGH